MVKAVFFDIDGTLVSFNTRQIPETTKEVIKKIRKSGIKVFIATGRHFSSINNLGDTEFDGYVTMNGCYCLTTPDNVIFKQSIPRSDLNAFIDHMQDVREFPSVFVEEHRLSLNYVDEEMEYLLSLLNNYSMPKHQLEYYRDKEVFQLTAFFKQPEEEEIMRVLPNCSAMRWYPTFADVIVKGVDKGVGIDQFCDYFGFSQEETMAFGDGGNDVEMLKHAGIGIAMGNARDEVKQVADYVTDSVDDNGVLNALKYFGLA